MQNFKLFGIFHRLKIKLFQTFLLKTVFLNHLHNKHSLLKKFSIKVHLFKSSIKFEIQRISLHKSLNCLLLIMLFVWELNKSYKSNFWYLLYFELIFILQLLHFLFIEIDLLFPSKVNHHLSIIILSNQNLLLNFSFYCPFLHSRHNFLHTILLVNLKLHRGLNLRLYFQF